MKYNVKTVSGAAAVAAVAVAMSAGAASAQGEMVSGSMGLSYNTNFVSYGFDVWGGGTDFFGSQSTVFAWGDVAFDFDPVVVNVGIWADINDNAATTIGGNFQEIDWYAGATYSAGIFSLGATYQEWNYAGDVERIVDLKVAWDDSGYMGGFSLAPSITWHFRIDGNGAQDEGSAIVLAIAPSAPLAGPVSLAFPMGVGFFVDDDFQGGTDGGFAYGYFGGSVGIPLGEPGPYGAWTLTTDLIYYTTDGDAIPGNVAGGFLTGAVGIKVGF
jgi:hypothetical protein